MQTQTCSISNDPDQCQAARLARDPRFDGLFYTAVLSTGIYCRPTCPARTPREDNVRYYASAAACADAGFRPCLRCRPDGAPGYRPANALVQQALAALESGQSLQSLAAALGVSDRYLRRCFNETLGVAPKQYQLYQRCLLAKQLLHETDWPVTHIAGAAGFQSLRRFNDCFVQQLQLTPTQVRKGRAPALAASTLTLPLSYRPPYDWAWVSGFLQARAIEGLEIADAQRYGRSLSLNGERCWFVAEHRPERCCFDVTLTLNDWRNLPLALAAVRRVLDLDANSRVIDQHLAQALPGVAINQGLRLPQFATVFEAGVRAVLGQQVSVKAARNLVRQLAQELGLYTGDRLSFPTPEAVAASELAFLKMPDSRRQALRRLAAFCADNPGADASHWLAIKGIGPWTVNYAQMRGAAHTDIWLDGDLGVRQALAKVGVAHPGQAAPWRSYLTIQLWSHLQ